MELLIFFSWNAGWLLQAQGHLFEGQVGSEVQFMFTCKVLRRSEVVSVQSLGKLLLVW